MADVARPAQGANSLNPIKPPRAAYIPAAGPRVTTRGTQSRPIKPPSASYGTDNVDIVPKVTRR